MSRFAPTSIAARRLVRDEHAGRDQQRPREEQLLLVAARQRAGGRLEDAATRRPAERLADRACARLRAGRTRGGSNRRRLARLTFSRTGRRRIRPSSLRDSGMSATPAAIEAAGPTRQRGLVRPARTPPAVARLAP